MPEHPRPFTESTAPRGLVSASTLNQALGSLLFLRQVAPERQKDRATGRRRADEGAPPRGPALDRAEFMTRSVA